MKRTVYLDYAAATPMDKGVSHAMEPYFAAKFYNPSAIYLAARSVSNDVQAARSQVAQSLGARPGEIVFTAGGTEANNLVLIGVAQQFPGMHIVTSSLEHESVRAPIEFLVSRGLTQTEVAPKLNGLLDPHAIARAVTEHTVLVSVMYANNEIGTVQPIKQIAQTLEGIRKNRQASGNELPLYLHTDACQAANYLDLHVHRLGVDLMTLNGGKIYGPKQSGVLFVAAQTKLLPIIHGGGQEMGIRSGTENVAAIVGFAYALQIAQAKSSHETTRLAGLQKEFLNLLGQKIPKARVNGSLRQRLPNNVHITIPGTDNERLLFAMDEQDIQCATGSACSASKAEPSHTLKSIGLSDAEAQASLRFTMGRGTTQADVRYTVETLAKLVA